MNSGLNTWSSLWLYTRWHPDSLSSAISFWSLRKPGPDLHFISLDNPSNTTEHLSISWSPVLGFRAAFRNLESTITITPKPLTLYTHSYARSLKFNSVAAIYIINSNQWDRLQNHWSHPQSIATSRCKTWSQDEIRSLWRPIGDDHNTMAVHSFHSLRMRWWTRNFSAQCHRISIKYYMHSLSSFLCIISAVSAWRRDVTLR